MSDLVIAKAAVTLALKQLGCSHGASQPTYTHAPSSGRTAHNGREIAINAAIVALRGRRPVNLGRKIRGGFTIEQVLTVAGIAIPA